MGAFFVTDVCYFGICISKETRGLISFLVFIVFFIMMFYTLKKIGFLDHKIED